MGSGAEAMMRILAALVCGLLFGIGLTVAQMTNPQKVLGFLDIATISNGGWDPSLALVLGGAVVTTAAGYRLVFRRDRPLLAGSFSLPTARDIDAESLPAPPSSALAGASSASAPARRWRRWESAGRRWWRSSRPMLTGMAIFRVTFDRKPSGGAIVAASASPKR